MDITYIDTKKDLPADQLYHLFYSAGKRMAKYVDCLHYSVIHPCHLKVSSQIEQWYN